VQSSSLLDCRNVTVIVCNWMIINLFCILKKSSIFLFFRNWPNKEEDQWIFWLYCQLWLVENLSISNLGSRYVTWRDPSIQVSKYRDTIYININFVSFCFLCLVIYLDSSVVHLYLGEIHFDSVLSYPVNM